MARRLQGYFYLVFRHLTDAREAWSKLHSSPDHKLANPCRARRKAAVTVRVGKSKDRAGERGSSAVTHFI